MRGHQRWIIDRRALFGLAGAALLAASDAAAAEDHGSLAEARALAERAVRHLAETGMMKAFADFADPKGGFIDRDLWVIVFRGDGQIVVNARVPTMLGKDANTIQDADGGYFGRAILARARSGMPGWVQYRLTNPATGQIQAKSSYVIEHDHLAVFVGAYIY